jgi:hypothetical protein
VASAFTAKNQMFDDAPAKRTLRGDKAKPESAQHIIEFPGGAVEVSRLDDGSYWAHIIVNRTQALESLAPGMGSAFGDVVGSRVDWAERRLEAIPSLPDEANLTQLAVRIMPRAATHTQLREED